MKEGDTLISVGEKFQLGFFRPDDKSENRYVGIWLHNIPNRTIVWVANKDHPLNDSAGILKIGDDGNLIILDESERLIWASGDSTVPSSKGSKVIARLLDSGNLVLTEDDHNSVNSGTFHWQSFDYPTDTLLAGMKIGWDLTNGFRRHLTSWKSLTDPSPGDFTYGIDIQGLPQIVIRKGSTKKYRTGPWIGGQFSGMPVNPPLIFLAQFTINSQDVHFTLDIYKRTAIARTVLTYEGFYELCMWSNDSQDWTVIKTLPSDSCDDYAKCGPNAICTISDPRSCSCLVGYVPKSTQEWDMLVWSGGCVRKNQSVCPGNERFKRIKGLKMPDLLSFRVNNSMSLEECKAECLSNCSCSAYANSNATGKHGSGCILWYGNLIDIRRLTEGTNLDLFVRVMASDLDTRANSKRRKLLLITSLSLTFVFSMLFLWVLWRRGRKKVVVKLWDEEDLELPIFDMLTISQATNNFSFSSKIGEGGFGPVYKGRLPNGQEIAVKRLSKDSRQGIDEFMNEAIFIAKLQHRNLVGLLGCCIEGEERMLVYEYMSNGSMDSLIFGDRREKSLVWRKQFNIILGIARGLLYLHQDSRLTIIHRDLKASNVLLDGEFNPKISDFGMARTFDGDLSRAKTRRIVGTYGYMSPEYAIDGIFSVKSDVFSFGVIVLEIVSGKRNREFQHLEHSFNLIGHAWKLWEEGRAHELIDREMEDELPASEVMRCIQVGLLCVQRHPEDRPTMSSVLTMLDSENFVPPQPKQPGFYVERNLEMNQRDCNSYAMTVTLVQGR